jgi:hypothetical protein
VNVPPLSMAMRIPDVASAMIEMFEKLTWLVSLCTGWVIEQHKYRLMTDR